MASAPQKDEQASHLGFRRDYNLASQKKRSRQRAVKFSTVAIHCRIDSIQHFYLQYSSFRQGV